MNILNRMNAVIEYIEHHLTEDIDLKHLSGIACCSPHTFQRLFTYITDISIVEYIRKRRLTLAALELQQSDIRIIDLAVKYGYDSPVSFTRAFQSIHGITPSEARKNNISLKAFPRMTFQIIIKGVSEMNYRIVKTESIRVFGLEGIVSTIGDKNHFSHVGAIWDENFNNGKYDQLFLDAGETRPPFYDSMFVRDDMCRIHGLLNYNPIDNTTYKYMQYSFFTPESKVDGYKIVEIPAATWAVFPGYVGNSSEPWKIWPMLYQNFYEWLPASEFEKAELEFEVYGGTPGDLYSELWICVVKKSSSPLTNIL